MRMNVGCVKGVQCITGGLVDDDQNLTGLSIAKGDEWHAWVLLGRY